MDSLFLVLTVLGGIMILAGVARMTSNRGHHKEDVDHSVLFSGREPSLKEQFDDVDEDVIEPSYKSASVSEEIKVEQQQQPISSESSHIESSSDFHQSVPDVDLPIVNMMVDPEDIPALKSKKRSPSIIDRIKSSTHWEADEEESEEQGKAYREGAPEWVVVLNVMAPKGQHFVGPALVDVIENNGLSFGEMEIFHYQNDEGEPMFSLVNMLKPGSFDMENIDSMTTPGVSLFIQIPAENVEGLKAFDSMLATAKGLADRLGGELRDERRSVLTRSAIDHLRQKIVEYDCKWLSH